MKSLDFHMIEHTRVYWFAEDASNMRRALYSITLVTSLVLVSCSSVHNLKNTLQDLVTVQSQLVKALGDGEVRINLNNGSFLAVGVVNSPLNDLSKDRKKAKALEIARLAFDSYPSRSALTAVSVSFGIHRSYLLGTFNYQNTTDSFAF